MFSRIAALFHQRLPVCLGFLALVSVLSQLDIADECSWTGTGPGLAFDENLNTAGGVYLVESVLNAGLAALDPRTVHEIFESPNYFPDYPPLGRLPLGVGNALFGRLGGLGEHSFYLISYARIGSAVTFSLLVFLLVRFTQQQAGTLAGVVTGLSLWATPRVFGHAHLANVETTMNLTYAGFLLVSLNHLAFHPQLRARDGVLPGFVLGLALLTKIQAIFLPPVITIWMLWHFRKRALLPLGVIVVTSAVTFLLGWPWLWSDPIGRSLSYFAQTTNRAVLYCFYMGVRYTDRSVPWHYPFVIFLLTTPLPWLLLGSWGMWRSVSCQSTPLTANNNIGRHKTSSNESGGNDSSSPWTWRANSLLLGAFWLPLIVFAIPGVPVYDGERLFLMVWPIFSIWVGMAAARCHDGLISQTPCWLRCLIAVLAIVLPVGGMFTLQPAYLSFYAVQAGTLPGASAAGMEQNYWGDAVTADFLKAACRSIPPGSTLTVAPVLHPLFPRFLKTDSWLKHRPDLEIVAYDEKSVPPPRYVLWIHRRADPWPALLSPSEGTRILARIKRQGVVLAEVLEFPVPPTSFD